MNQNRPPVKAGNVSALNEGLAQWFGWFEAAPLPEGLAGLIEQLEAGNRPAEQVELLGR
jgi:hypothetical protein